MPDAIASCPEEGTIVDSGGVQQDEVRRCLRLLEPCTSSTSEKVRFGDKGDGGYVMLDDFAGACRAISLGTGENVSWDLAMADRGLLVDQYDDRLSASPVSHANFFFRKRLLAPVAASGAETLEHAIGRHEAVILKVDIESAEWDVLEATPSDILKQCRQIAVEFHGLRSLSERVFLDRATRVFAHLVRTHAVVHVHANNYGGIYCIQGVPAPDVLEVTFASRDHYVFSPCHDVFPGPLDSANCPWRPDLVIGCFRF